MISGLSLAVAGVLFLCAIIVAPRGGTCPVPKARNTWLRATLILLGLSQLPTVAAVNHSWSTPASAWPMLAADCLALLAAYSAMTLLATELREGERSRLLGHSWMLAVACAAMTAHLPVLFDGSDQRPAASIAAYVIPLVAYAVIVTAAIGTVALPRLKATEITSRSNRCASAVTIAFGAAASALATGWHRTHSLAEPHAADQHSHPGVLAGLAAACTVVAGVVAPPLRDTLRHRRRARYLHRLEPLWRRLTRAVPRTPRGSAQEQIPSGTAVSRQAAVVAALNDRVLDILDAWRQLPPGPTHVSRNSEPTLTNFPSRARIRLQADDVLAGLRAAEAGHQLTEEPDPMPARLPSRSVDTAARWLLAVSDALDTAVRQSDTRDRARRWPRRLGPRHT